MFIDQARGKLKAVAEQRTAGAALEEALLRAEKSPSAASRSSLAEAWGGALRAGVALLSVIDAQRRLRLLERHQTVEAEATLAWLASARDADADTLAAAAASAEAMAGGTLDGSSALRDARAALAAAREKHAALEDAGSAVVLLATPRPIDDYPAVELALGRARQVGVDTYSYSIVYFSICSSLV